MSLENITKEEIEARVASASEDDIEELIDILDGFVDACEHCRPLIRELKKGNNQEAKQIANSFEKIWGDFNKAYDNYKASTK